MKRFHHFVIAFGVASALLLLVSAPQVRAQNPPDELPDNAGRTALQNVGRPFRSPGQMVRDGVIAANQIRAPQLQLDITGTPEEPIEALLLADTIDILFEQLVQAIQLFESVLRARAGLPPRTSSLLSGVPAALAGLTRKTLDSDESSVESPAAAGSLVHSRLSSLRRPSNPAR